LLTALCLFVLRRLGGEACHCTARQGPKQASAVQQQAAGGGACSCSKCQLKLPEQQQHIVSSFRLQVRQPAAKAACVHRAAVYVHVPT
jgi:hypothetical protein